MKTYILKENPPADQDSWKFQLPNDALVSLRRDRIIGKSIKFTAEAITLHMDDHLTSNRILQTDDPSKFILASFGDLRFPDSSMRVTTDYINRLMKAGLFLNNIQYRFYHHSNNQLVCANYQFERLLNEVWFSSEVVAVFFVKQIRTQSSMPGYISLVISEES